uniref:Odorant receptor n=1 Tax=Glossina morsitans morsitans TaxID=37546 RepID=A0A1B0FMI2_GLOMM
MFNPVPANDKRFHWPRQCVWLKLNGSWPLKSTKEFQSEFYTTENYSSFLYILWSWYVILSVGVTIVYQTAFLITNFGDIMMTTENCCTTFMGALNFVRLLHMRLNQNQFRRVIEQFVNNIWINREHHPQVAHECENRMSTFRIMTILLSCLIAMYCLLPLIILFVDVGWNAPEKPFPYKMLFPYDAHNGWRYAFTYVFTSYAGICVVTTLFAEDSIFGFFITYTCGKFRILHQRIDNIISDSIEVTSTRQNDNNVQRIFEKKLNEIAYDHNKLIEFSNRLEHFFNPILLVNFLISSVLICMVGFQLVTGQEMFIGDYVKFIVYISSSLSQLYILCWNGDDLIQHSTETAKHLYGCNWEGTTLNIRNAKKFPKWHRAEEFHLTSIHPTNKEFRQNLQIMILCSQRPVKITALKFSILSLQSFTAILSTSMSYFTLLQTVYNADQEEDHNIN